jgi:hypothetical protein
VKLFHTAVVKDWAPINDTHSGPLHTQDLEPVTITLQAFPLVEKAELVQVHFTLRLRHQRSMWMQDGCKSLYGFLHGIKWIVFYGHLDYFQKPPLGGRPNTNGETMTLRMLTTIGLFYFIMCEGPTWIEVHCNSIWLRARSYMRSHYTWESVTTLHDFGGEVGRPLDTFLLSSHNFMVTALGSCVKWPSDLHHLLLNLGNSVEK